MPSSRPGSSLVCCGPVAAVLIGTGTRGLVTRWTVSVAAAAVIVLTVAGQLSSVSARAATPARRAAAGIIKTVAGGVGGPGRATKIAMGPTGVVYRAGRVYISDGVVRSLSTRTDRVTTAAGALALFGLRSLGDGGPALEAIMQAWSSAFDRAGNLLIADEANNLVRVVAARSGTFYGVKMKAGHIYAVAGTGRPGFSGDGGRATNARLNAPIAAVADHEGNLVIADNTNRRIRVVAAKSGTFYGLKMTTGDIYTVAGHGQGTKLGNRGPARKARLIPRTMTVDRAGNLIVADELGLSVRVVAVRSGRFYGVKMTAGDIYSVAGDGASHPPGDGGPATKAGLFPESVTLDGAGNLVITDGANNLVRVVAVKSGKFFGVKMIARHIYAVAGDGQEGFVGDGGPATDAKFHIPEGVTVDGKGNLVVADVFNNRVRVVAARTGKFYGRAMTAHDIYTVAGTGGLFYSGDGGPATAAELNAPGSVAVDGAGNLVIADSSNSRVRVAAAQAGSYYGQSMAAGHIYNVVGNGTYGSSGDGGPAGQAELSVPAGLTMDASGNVMIADEGNNRVRAVAVKSGKFLGVTMTAGDIYTVAGDGSSGFSGDGGSATSAELNAPQGVGLDGNGNLLIADTGNNRVRVVAAKTGTFYGQVMTAGRIYTVAGDGTGGFAGDGGPATGAELSFPHGITVDHSGNLVITDTSNSRVRVVAAASGTYYGQAMTAGHIYTVAGDGIAGGAGDGGPAINAELGFPETVAVDSAKNLVIADTGTNRVRVVAAKSGTFYGVAMKAGHIYAVAGDGIPGVAGDGGPAVKARLASPGGVAVDGGGNLVIADSGTNRIRRVTR